MFVHFTVFQPIYPSLLSPNLLTLQKSPGGWAICHLQHGMQLIYPWCLGPIDLPHAYNILDIGSIPPQDSCGKLKSSLGFRTLTTIASFSNRNPSPPKINIFPWKGTVSIWKRWFRFFGATSTWFRFPARLPAIEPPGSNPPSYRGEFHERSGDGDGIPDAPPSRRDWRGTGGGMPCLEDHASGCKWLGITLIYKPWKGHFVRGCYPT